MALQVANVVVPYLVIITVAVGAFHWSLAAQLYVYLSSVIRTWLERATAAFHDRRPHQRLPDSLTFILLDHLMTSGDAIDRLLNARW